MRFIYHYPEPSGPDGDVLDSPDNIVVSPRGGLVICEDDSSSANLNQNDESEFFGEDKNRLIGLTLQGTPFPIAENIVNDEQPVAVLYFPQAHAAYSDKLQNFKPSAWGTDLLYVWIQQ